ncbi:hypothetical protein [Sinorhizobium chiapasense]|uniref:Uncharacterized protein n=1 Tax=Sinorhizobium chiapasense TaxID=501572 RepID=A0ABZ2B9R2_9HYPH
MRLENDIAIRREVLSILADDVALGVGDGWHQLVGKALVGIQDLTDGQVTIRKVSERSGLLTIATDAARSLFDDATMRRVYAITGVATDASASACEMCGCQGRLITTARPRVRCAACGDDEPARQRVWQQHRGGINEAAAYYLRVCLEHSRLFPVANIVVRVCLDDRDHRVYLDEVHDRLVWWRGGSWLEGVDEAVRDQFRRLDFDRR